MKIKLLRFFTSVLSGGIIAANSNAGIVYPMEPDGGRQTVMQFASDFVGKNLPPFTGISTTSELTFAPPLVQYGAGDLANGQLLPRAESGRNGLRMWTYTFRQGTNVVGVGDLEADEKTGKPLKCISLGDAVFAEKTKVALQTAEIWPQVQNQDYEPRLLNDPLVSFVAVWLHGTTNDIIIPLPPTYNRMNAYQPYSETQIIRILAPEARRDIAMWKRLNDQRLKDDDAYAKAMTDYENAHGGKCGPVSLYGMSAPFQNVSPHVQIFTLTGKSTECGKLEYKVKVTFAGRFEDVKNVEILEKLPDNGTNNER